MEKVWTIKEKMIYVYFIKTKSFFSNDAIKKIKEKPYTAVYRTYKNYSNSVMGTTNDFKNGQDP